MPSGHDSTCITLLTGTCHVPLCTNGSNHEFRNNQEATPTSLVMIIDPQVHAQECTHIRTLHLQRPWVHILCFRAHNPTLTTQRRAWISRIHHSRGRRRSKAGALDTASTFSLVLSRHRTALMDFQSYWALYQHPGLVWPVRSSAHCVSTHHKGLQVGIQDLMPQTRCSWLKRAARMVNMAELLM